MDNFNNFHSDYSSPLDGYHSFLKSLIGEEVQVYKGGPESRKGKVIDVQSDYIAIYAHNNNNNKNKNNDGKSDQNKNKEENQNNNQNRIIYYRTQHLQTICENTKSNSMPRFQSQNQEEEEIQFHTGYDFNDLASKLVGKHVQINQGGPESKTGLLINVSVNYISLLSEDDGVVYYSTYHLKSICEHSKETHENQNDTDTQQDATVPDYIVTDDFHDLFGEMSHKWVAINRGGPEALEGILVQSDGGYYTVVNGDEVLRINPPHVKSISCGPKGSMKKNNNSQQQNDQNTNEDGNNPSDSSNYNKNRDSRKSSSSSSSYRSSSSSSSYRKRTSSSSSHGKRARSSGKRTGRSSGKMRKSSGTKRTSSSSSSKHNFTRRHQSSSNKKKIIKTVDYFWKPKS